MNMILNHFHRLHEIGRSIELQLIVGQTSETGIHTKEHEDLIKLCQFGRHGRQLDCRYKIKNEPVKFKCLHLAEEARTYHCLFWIVSLYKPRI